MTMQTEAARNDSGEPPYDPDVWGQKDFTERVQQAARDYVLRGMGYPASVYVFHVVKILALASGWMFWVSFTPGLGNPLTIGEWIFHPMALQKAFIWGCMFETLGFGCMSGPLGLKVWPPFTAFLHYLRPGATKLAWRPDLPVLGGYTRSWLDVTLYALFVLSMGWALVQPEITAVHLVPIIVLLPLAALGDRMIFLTSRGEHHWAMIVIFLLCGPWFTGSSTSWIAGAKWVQLSIWFWAGVSKLTVAFAYVVPVMTANNPMLKNPEFRRRLFKSWPDDLQPSTLGKVMAHAGTFLEFAAPLTLIWVTQSGPLLYLGMFWVIMLHGFIISNVPIAAVFEWNLLSLYAGFFLFWAHPEVSLFSVGSDLAAVYLVVGCLIVPLLGNLAPSWISFLTSMRYYAGNWAWNAWLFHENAHKKLHKLKRAAPLLLEQQ